MAEAGTSGPKLPAGWFSHTSISKRPFYINHEKKVFSYAYPTSASGAELQKGRPKVDALTLKAIREQRRLTRRCDKPTAVVFRAKASKFRDKPCILGSLADEHQATAELLQGPEDGVVSDNMQFSLIDPLSRK